MQNITQRILIRCVRSPRTLARLVVDRICTPAWLRWLGVTVGERCLFVGQPVVRLASGAMISLGNEVRLFSRGDIGIGLAHPTILATLESGASITIGEKAGISGASIVARTDITIGRNVLIGAGAGIWDTDFHPLDPVARRADETAGARAAPIVIEDDVFIGTRAIILKGVRIGCGAVVGAGAVVTKNVGALEIVAGNPAKVVGTLAHPIEWNRIGVKVSP